MKSFKTDEGELSSWKKPSQAGEEKAKPIITRKEVSRPGAL
jgi:hypothetical protein